MVVVAYMTLVSAITRVLNSVGLGCTWLGLGLGGLRTKGLGTGLDKKQ